LAGRPRRPFEVPRIVPSAVLKVPPTAAGAQPSAPTELLAGGGGVRDLFGHFDLLSPEAVKQVKQLKVPAANQAQVLRFISLQGDQIVGGYTLIVQGA
jgi:hypothetical protein